MERTTKAYMENSSTSLDKFILDLKTILAKISKKEKSLLDWLNKDPEKRKSSRVEELKKELLELMKQEAEIQTKVIDQVDLLIVKANSINTIIFRNNNTLKEFYPSELKRFLKIYTSEERDHIKNLSAKNKKLELQLRQELTNLAIKFTINPETLLEHFAKYPTVYGGSLLDILFAKDNQLMEYFIELGKPFSEEIHIISQSHGKNVLDYSHYLIKDPVLWYVLMSDSWKIDFKKLHYNIIKQYVETLIYNHQNSPY